eukprot:scaffold70785_cov55-Attheya_sp.AAC.2
MYRTDLVFVGVLGGLLFNHGLLKLFSTAVGVFNGSALHEILELDGGFGSSPCLLHDAEANDPVGFSISQLHRHSILNVRRVNRHNGQLRVLRFCGP